jgi:hypothetical protein
MATTITVTTDTTTTGTGIRGTTATRRIVRTTTRWLRRPIR